MSHESHGKSVQNEVIVPVEAQPVTDGGQAATAAATATTSEPNQSPSSRTTRTKNAARAKDVKKVVAEPVVPQEAVAKAAPVQKRPAKSVSKAAAESKSEVAKVEKAPKDKKQPTKKPKLVRDSFTIPEADYELFESLKRRVLSSGVEVKKSELLRAALATLAKLDDAELVKTISLVERIKTGRPKK